MEEQRQIYKLASLAAFAAILATSGVAQAAFADQPYIAGYGIDGTNVYNANAGYMLTYYANKNGQNPTQDLLSVLTMQGSTGGTSGETGFAYQGVTHWDTDTYIYSDDQVWGPNQAKTSYGRVDLLNSVQLVPKSQLSRISTNPAWNTAKTQVQFSHIIYKTDGTSFQNINYYTKQNWEPSTYFLYGQCTGSACYSGNPSSNTFVFWQFGLEGPTETNNFDVKQTTLQFYNAATSSWVSLSGLHAYLTYGDANLVGWWTDNTNTKRSAYVGGFSYYDAYPKALLTDGSYSAGTVEWDARSCGGARCVSLPHQLW